MFSLSRPHQPQCQLEDTHADGGQNIVPRDTEGQREEHNAFGKDDEGRRKEGGRVTFGLFFLLFFLLLLLLSFLFLIFFLFFSFSFSFSFFLSFSFSFFFFSFLFFFFSFPFLLLFLFLFLFLLKKHRLAPCTHLLSDLASSFPSLLKAGSECLVSTLFFQDPNTRWHSTICSSMGRQ